MSSFWNKDTIDELIKLDAEKLSHSEISKRIGVSRSAIGAKLRRLAKKGIEVTKRDQRQNPNGNKKKEPKPKVVIPPKIQHNRYTIMTKPFNHKNMSKKDMYDMLKAAVENTK